MYKKINIRQARKSAIPSVPVSEFECDHTYKPFGYYVNGGSDPTGENTDMTGAPSCDSVEDISSGASVDAFADPRTNFFDVVEQIGFDNAKSSSDALSAGEKEDKK